VFHTNTAFEIRLRQLALFIISSRNRPSEISRFRDLTATPPRDSASFTGIGSHGCDFDIEPVCFDPDAYFLAQCPKNSLISALPLLGLSLQPRLAKLRHQRLFKFSKDRHYGELEPLFDGIVSEDLIREQWDELMRVITSKRNRHAAPTGIGKVDKAVFLLRWFHDPELRRDTGLQLNRGEHRQSLAQWLFFANQSASSFSTRCRGIQTEA